MAGSGRLAGVAAEAGTCCSLQALRDVLRRRRVHRRDCRGVLTANSALTKAVPQGGASTPERASEAAFKAARNADQFTAGAKHLADAGGKWAKFAEGVNPNAVLRGALESPTARFLPNDTSFGHAV